MRPGDRLRVIGRVVQEAGLIRFRADSLRLLAAAQPLFAPLRPAGPLADSTEPLPVELRRVRLLSPAQWTGQGYPGFGADQADSVRTYRTYIHRRSGLYRAAAPFGTFTLRGLVHQFDPETLFTDGYELWPRSAQDISLVLATRGAGAEIGFGLHPNPTAGLLDLTAPPTEKLRQLEVLNVLGQRLRREKVAGGHSAGLYLLRISTDAQTVTRRSEKP